jgi:uncharacterized protein (DUF2249 family)
MQSATREQGRRSEKTSLLGSSVNSQRLEYRYVQILDRGCSISGFIRRLRGGNVGEHISEDGSPEFRKFRQSLTKAVREHVQGVQREDGPELERVRFRRLERGYRAF